ncbi:MAG TPA: hypothetical protein VK530_05590 [Candidatus Acidoferrum sp.]|nr:hypothetical protein [Candidatus Acidoferrum sp.]
MNRALTIINGIGVLALAVICVTQWRSDRSLNIEVSQLQRANQVQLGSLVEQSNTLRGVNEDLAQFKERFSKAHAELSDALASARNLERENTQIVAERDQLKASVTNWSAAVAERDVRLKETLEQGRELSRKLNESVTRFNELATNYNASVRRFSELATNYNSVVDQLNELRKPSKTPEKSSAATK